MKKRSFWKGFGTGVLFATIILGISCLIRTSDANVVKQAKKLGMVFEKESDDSDTVVSNKKNQADAPQNTESQANAPQNANQSDSSQNAENQTVDVDNAQNQGNDQDVVPTPEIYDATEAPVTPVTETDSQKSKKSGNSKKSDTSKKKKNKSIDMEKEKTRMSSNINKEKEKLTIKPGEWSEAVSKKLETMGIVKDDKSFDKYLNSHGYSSSIAAGTYNVSKNDTYEELAKKITGK